jgi:hypothetical protein
MIAQYAYLTSPSEGRYIFNYKIFGSGEVIQVELDPDHMRNILATGVPLMLRQSFHRVPTPSPNEEKSHERAASGA